MLKNEPEIATSIQNEGRELPDATINIHDGGDISNTENQTNKGSITSF